MTSLTDFGGGEVGRIGATVLRDGHVLYLAAGRASFDLDIAHPGVGGVDLKRRETAR